MAKKDQKFINISAQEKKALLYFSRNLKKELKDNLIKISLYGSKARGDAGKYSDTDVLVVLKRMSERSKNKVYALQVKVVQKYSLIISLNLMSEKQYTYEKELPSLFMQFIEQEAIEL